MAMMPKPRTKLLRNNEDGEMAVQDNAFGFNHVLKGYSPEEVNDYINNLSDSYRNTQTVLNKQREEFESEKEMLVCEINDMKESRDQYKQQAEEMQATIEELREEILALASGEIGGGTDESTVKELERLMEENNKLMADIESSRKEKEELKADIRSLTEENRNLADAQASGATDSAAMESMLAKQKELEGKIASLKDERDSLESKLEESKSLVASMPADGGISDEELEVLRMENNDLVEKNRSLSIEMAKVQKKSRLATEEAEKATSSLKALEDSISALNKEKASLNEELEKAISEKNDVADTIAKLTSEKGKLEESIKVIESEKNDLADTVAIMQTEKDQLADQLELSKAETAEVSNKAKAIKEALAGLMETL